MSNLEKAKEIIKAHYSDAECGIFNSRNIVGDVMNTIYEGDGLTIDICYGWQYFEVFGLSGEEFEELEEHYCSLGESEVTDETDNCNTNTNYDMGLDNRLCE